MMINCPRCGFHQPQDQYCANCGVDMQSFKPPAPSLVTRFSNSTTAQIVALTLVVLIGFALIYRSQRSSEISDRIHFLKGHTFVGSEHDQFSSETNEEDSTEETSNASKGGSPLAPPAPPAPSGQPAVGFGANSTGAKSNFTDTKTGAPEGKGDAKGESTTMTLVYGEIDAHQKIGLIQESQSRNQFFAWDDPLGEVDSGIVQDSKSLLSKVRVTQKIEKTLTAQKNSDQWFMGENRETPKEMSLFNFLSITDSQGAEIKGEVEILRTWKESKNSFPATFDLAKGQGFYYIGLIPHTNEKEEPNGNGILSVLRSQSFKSKQSDFIVIIMRN